MHDMSENVKYDLSRLVERTVQPIRSSLSRKQRMREELLGHLEAIYEENYQQSHDEQAALFQAKTRFGDPEVLTHELKKSLPRGDVVQYVLEKLRWEPGESAGHFVAKHLLLSAALWGAMLLLLLVILQFFPGRPTTLALLIRIFSAVALISTAYSAMVVLCGTSFSRALFGHQAQKSRRSAMITGLASLLIIPTLTFVAYGALANGLPPRSILLISACGSPVMLLFFLLVARKAAADIRYEEEWASLRIDD